MRASDSIKAALERAFEDQEPKQKTARDRKRKSAFGKPPDPKTKPTEKIEIVGYPIIGPLKWDDLGLGMIRSMGFLPTKAVKIEITKDRWILHGARVNYPVIIFIVAGAGGLIPFMRDLLDLTNADWGAISKVGSSLLVILPILINLIVRSSKLEFFPFEIEFFGYDAQSHLLILSTLTQPGGLVAMRLDLPSNPKNRKVEEERLIKLMAKAHTGFSRIDGMAQQDYSGLKHWSLWTLVWLLVIWLYLAFG